MLLSKKGFKNGKKLRTKTTTTDGGRTDGQKWHNLIWGFPKIFLFWLTFNFLKNLVKCFIWIVFAFYSFEKFCLIYDRHTSVSRWGHFLDHFFFCFFCFVCFLLFFFIYKLKFPRNYKLSFSCNLNNLFCSSILSLIITFLLIWLSRGHGIGFNHRPSNVFKCDNDTKVIPPLWFFDFLYEMSTNFLYKTKLQILFNVFPK